MSEEIKLEGKMAEFVDWIETISVLELSQLVKALEERLGVSAAAPVAEPAPEPQPSADPLPADPDLPEPSTYAVTLSLFPTPISDAP